LHLGAVSGLFGGVVKIHDFAFQIIWSWRGAIGEAAILCSDSLALLWEIAALRSQ